MSFFITFEGIEGSGKTTQINLLKDFFELQKKQVLVTREPGDTPLGQKIRQIVLDPNEKIHPVSELCLYLADRSEHCVSVIRPALNEKKIVLCDRFTDSTLAYQGGGREISESTLEFLNQFVSQGVTPHLTFLLDCPAETGIERAHSRSLQKIDRIEAESIEFHRKVRARYLELAKREPTRIKTIDGSQTVSEIHNQIKEAILPFL